MTKLKNGFKLFFITCVFISLSSCANTVSSKDLTVEVDVTISFFEAIDTDNYRYFIALSNDSTPKISAESLSATIDQNDYLPTPGRSYSEQILLTLTDTNKQSLSYYYDTYFDSWVDYICIDSAGIQLYKSNSSGFTLADEDNEINSHQLFIPDTGFPDSLSFSNQNKTLSFTIPVDQLSSPIANNTTLYFRLFVSKKTNLEGANDSGRLVDRIDEDNTKLTLQKNEEIEVNNLENFQLNALFGPGDISSYKLKVF